MSRVSAHSQGVRKKLLPFSEPCSDRLAVMGHRSFSCNTVLAEGKITVLASILNLTYMNRSYLYSLNKDPPSAAWTGLSQGTDLVLVVICVLAAVSHITRSLF